MARLPVMDRNRRNLAPRLFAVFAAVGLAVVTLGVAVAADAASSSRPTAGLYIQPGPPPIIRD